jgi:hypothetical protein
METESHDEIEEEEMAMAAKGFNCIGKYIFLAASHNSMSKPGPAGNIFKAN